MDCMNPIACLKTKERVNRSAIFLLTIIPRHISGAFVGNPYPPVFAFFFATWTELEGVDHQVEVKVLSPHLQHLVEQIASTAREKHFPVYLMFHPLVVVETWVIDQMW